MPGGLEHEFVFFSFRWEFHFIPTDEQTYFFRGVGSTTNEIIMENGSVMIVIVDLPPIVMYRSYEWCILPF